MLGKASKRTGKREVQRRCPPPTKRRRQVAPGPPAKPHSHNRIAEAVLRAVQLASAAAPHKPIPGHRAGSPHRIAIKSQHTAQPLRLLPGHRRTQHRHARVTERPSQTSEPPALQTASPKKRPAACGAAGVCWGEASGKLKAHGANVATQHRRSKPTPAIQKATQRVNDSMLQNKIGTTKGTSKNRRATRLRLPNRLPAQPLQQRSGQRHAVLRKCAEAERATSPKRGARQARSPKRGAQMKNQTNSHRWPGATLQKPAPPVRQITSKKKWSAACSAAEVRCGEASSKPQYSKAENHDVHNAAPPAAPSASKMLKGIARASLNRPRRHAPQTSQAACHASTRGRAASPKHQGVPSLKQTDS